MWQRQIRKRCGGGSGGGGGSDGSRGSGGSGCGSDEGSGGGSGGDNSDGGRDDNIIASVTNKPIDKYQPLLLLPLPPPSRIQAW